MNLNFEKIFKATLIVMKINRSHPFIKRNAKWLINFCFVHGIYFTVFAVIFQNIIINAKLGNITETCKNGTYAIVFLANTFAYIILVWKQPIIKSLILDMKKDYIKSRSLPQEEQDIILTYALRGGFVCKTWFGVTSAGVFIFPIKNIASMTLSYLHGDFKLLPMHELIYPSFIEERKDQLIVYIITYMLLFLYACYSSSLYTSFAPLGPLFMLHASGRLVVIRKRVDVILKSGDLEEIRLKFYDIIKELQYIYSFVGRINVCFQLAYDAIFKLSSITLPIVCYEIIESLKVGDISLEFIMLVVGSVLFSSFPCYYSDHLMEKGEELRQAIYFCGWERFYCRRLRSSLLMMLQRAAKPVAIRSMFNVLCLEALTDVFREAYTIFNLMNAAWS